MWVKFMMDCICCSKTLLMLVPLQSTLVHPFSLSSIFFFKSVLNKSQSPVINNVVIPSSSWHLRLGHPSDAKLSSLKNVLSDVVCTFNKECEICPLAKHKRLPFSFLNHISKFPSDIVHCEYGPQILSYYC